MVKHLSQALQPPAKRGGCLVFDQSRQQAVLVLDGSTWLRQDSSWHEVSSSSSPPARSTTHLAYDSTTGSVLLFGGIGLDGAPLNDTWLWDGSNWTEQHPDLYPDPVGGAALVGDLALNQVVLFGGIGFPQDASDSHRAGRLSSSTWTWNGSTWTEHKASLAPSARVGSLLVYDAARQQTLLYGGQGPTGYLTDLWLWQGSSWRQLATAIHPPTGTRAWATFHEPLQQVLFLVEAMDLPTTNPQALTTLAPDQQPYQTWLWNGAAWTYRAPDLFLSGSIECFTYDSMEQTILAHAISGGKALLPNKASALLPSLPDLPSPTFTSQTWTWNENAWQLSS